MLCGEAATVSVHARAPWLEAAVATGALSLARRYVENKVGPPRFG